MRVLRVSHSAVVDAWRARERALRDAGVEMQLLSAQRWDEGGTVVPLEPTPGEQVTGVRTFGSHPALFLFDPRPLWKEFGKPWDLIDIHEEPFALATAQILLIRALRRVSAPFALYSAQNIRKRYPAPFRWIERWALRHASALSVCNSEAGRICEDKGFPGAARLIPLGIDARQYSPGPGRPRTATITVGYVGRLAPHKGVDVLLSAVAADNRLSLRVAGDGPQAAELRATAATPPLAGRVEFVGSLSQRDLPEFYRSLDVLAVPSLPTSDWREQFGRVAVEAMACGVPVVASDSGALPDVVGGAGLLVPPGDATALTEALLKVGCDLALAARFREQGLIRAGSCDWHAVAEEYLRMYGVALHLDSPESGPGVRRRPVEVVLVAYGSPDLVRQALQPVRSLPVTVVDNSSLPEIAAICAELRCRYIDSQRNGGFAFGVNLALASRRRPDADVLLLNPDAVIDVEGVFKLQDALLADPRLASVGPRQVDAEDREARVGWPFPSPWGTWLEAFGLSRLRASADFVIGSVMLLRAEALAQVGCFDERFFLYAEETDWAYRAHRLGWQHAVVESVIALHLGAATSSDSMRREAHFHGSQERYLRKHFGSTGWQIARAGQVVGAFARSAVLRDERGAAAGRRARLYVRGPLRVEAGFGATE